MKRRAVLAGMAVAVALTGCQKVTRTVGSQVSPCFRALPPAHAALGGQGTFVDVVRVRGRGALRFPSKAAGTPTTTAAPSGASGPSRDVCVIAYKGSFDPSRVQHLLFGAEGERYALVIVPVRTNRVRFVVLTNRLPSPLHAH